MSPLLFSLFINSLGPELNASGLGIDLGSINISALLFADDLVLIAKSRQSLDTLMSISLRYFDKHHLKLSEKKSKVMTYNSETGNTSFNDAGPSPISLEQVLSFKYLGINLSITPYNLFKDYNLQVRQKSQNYLASVLSLVKTGPDRSELAYTLWTCVALPSILYGAEVIPLTQATITEVEKHQALIGKFILQIPRSSANVASNIDAGLKPIWACVAEKVLLYSNTVMGKAVTYWPKIAMGENLAKGSQNPYTRYLLKWKVATDTFNVSPRKIKDAVHQAAVVSVLNQQKTTYLTTFAMNCPETSTKERWFKPKTWVNDSGSSKILAQFRACNIGLGNRGPTSDGQQHKLCPLCAKHGNNSLNNEVRKFSS